MHYCLTGNTILSACNEVSGELTFNIVKCTKAPCEMNENTKLYSMQIDILLKFIGLKNFRITRSF
jgi:hypothetical protein